MFQLSCSSATGSRGCCMQQEENEAFTLKLFLPWPLDTFLTLLYFVYNILSFNTHIISNTFFTRIILLLHVIAGAKQQEVNLFFVSLFKTFSYPLFYLTTLFALANKDASAEAANEYWFVCWLVWHSAAPNLAFIYV